MQNLNRITPAGGAEDYQTYQIVAPKSTHWRDARCEEVECPNQERGWRTVIDESTKLGERQAWYIRNQSGRKYTEERTAGTTTFYFPPDQQCFEPHKIRLDKPELFLVRGGDWRGNPRQTPTKQHVRASDWVDDFATHQQTLAEIIERG